MGSSSKVRFTSAVIRPFRTRLENSWASVKVETEEDEEEEGIFKVGWFVMDQMVG